MHFTVLRPWPSVISKIGPARVRSSTDPRTSPITDAIVPATSSAIGSGFSRSS